MTAMKKSTEHQVIEFIPPKPIRPIAVSVETATSITSLSKRALYRLAAQKRLRIVKIGTRTAILYADLEKLFAE